MLHGMPLHFAQCPSANSAILYAKAKDMPNRKRWQTMANTPHLIVHARTIALGPPATVSCRANCTAGPSVDASCMLLTHPEGTLRGAEYVVSAGKAAEVALNQGKSSLATFFDTSSHLRGLIRAEHIHPGPMSLAITTFRGSHMQIAWSGDVFTMRVRGHSVEVIAHPSRAGQQDLAHDPLGSAPAFTKRLTQNNDVVLTLSRDVATAIRDDPKLWPRLGKAKTLEDASLATVHAILRSGIDTGGCHIVHVREVY